uniref:F-box associated domain-containing protein n=1 Tax=Oryza punctata TaxID=4537 RepID=A0A0E0M3A9_ORYPU
MGLSRRFQNLIVGCPYSGAQWLRSIDLTRHLFGNTAAARTSSTIGQGLESAIVRDATSNTPAADSCNNPKNKRGLRIQMERIRFPSPILRFKCTHMPNRRNIDCFPIADRKVVMVDHTGSTRLCDVDARSVRTMPNIHKPKSNPISLFVPSSGGGSLYVMEKYPSPEKRGDGVGTQLSDQFEAFVWGKSFESPCHCHLLPPPPFVHDNDYFLTHPKITSYAVVGSDIYISTYENGSYCLDTEMNSWLQLAKEMPPPFFSGKLEYVPELKLWFGFSTEPNRHLAAADLSSASAMMDSQPQLIGDWNEFAPPEGWWEYQVPQLVNLGSTRFCISRFFHIRSMDDYEVIDSVIVFTGVEVMPVGHNGDGTGSANGEVKLRMEKHKSICCVSGRTQICSIF